MADKVARCSVCKAPMQDKEHCIHGHAQSKEVKRG
jgi:hypothetical protein